ncbi:hypothetical protein [Streptomyces showdoensis]|uniref:Uncharacterized protein n=1 Tax=Streptomyces showdoensis TaxID=68268 RepID=A0A2P2GT05_STREW|nr:hypothetical protein [Streptomyces showdoensis]KKZ74626.1 hypothetical protein VO63_05900 [Streptomyces showdoensis]
MTDSEEAVRTSARGWLTLQLAALGFVGLCGALKAGGGPGTAPRGVEAVAGVLVLVALLLAVLAVYLVGRTAWPHSGPDDPDRAARRLRTGLILTFATVLLTALAATSSWWPAPEDAGTPSGAGAGSRAVEVVTSTGALCGELTRGSGAFTLVVQGRTVDVPLTDVTSVTPVAGCGSA